MPNQNLTYFPKNITRNAIITYLLALMTCSVLYMKYALMWYWVFFGVIEVVGFFYFSNVITKDWQWLSDKAFSNKLFNTSLVIRVLYVLFSYWFYYVMTDGTYFDMNAADVLYYHDVAKHVSNQIRNGEWNIISNVMSYGQATFSDSGYMSYLSIVYYVSNDNILFSRLLKALWSSWTVLLVYKLAYRNFGSNIARIAAIMCMLMPNFIYYCGLHLKEIEMVFLEMLFIERADNILREKRLKAGKLISVMLIPIVLFAFRTALAAVLIIALGTAILLSKNRIISKTQRIVLIIGMTLFVGILFLGNTSFGKDVVEMWQTGASKQKDNMEWRSKRKNGNEFAKYAGAAVFAPMIFTIPFPTMVETDGQEGQKMIHGGNFDKNIISFFTIFAMFLMLFSGKWREHVLPIAVLCGYLFVLVFSEFAHSERFHLPSLPLSLMFAADGIIMLKTTPRYKRRFGYWCVFMFFAAVAWNWFKLAGRGLI